MTNLLRASKLIPERMCRPPSFAEIMGVGAIRVGNAAATRLGNNSQRDRLYGMEAEEPVKFRRDTDLDGDGQGPLASDARKESQDRPCSRKAKRTGIRLPSQENTRGGDCLEELALHQGRCHGLEFCGLWINDLPLVGRCMISTSDKVRGALEVRCSRKARQCCIEPTAT